MMNFESGEILKLLQSGKIKKESSSGAKSDIWNSVYFLNFSETNGYSGYVFCKYCA